MWKRGARAWDREGDGSGPSVNRVGKERKVKFRFKGKKGRKHVHVDEPLALVLTPAACQAALFWAAGVLLGRSSEVLERGGLGTNGDGTKGVPCTGPGYNEEVEFDLELPGVTYPPCGN
jgi:hypothetical protein